MNDNRAVSVARTRWEWSRWKALPLCTGLILFDLAFFISNLHKFAEGGWLPLAIAFAVLAVMHTWKLGRAEIYKRVYGNNVTDTELTAIARSKPRL